MCGAEPPFADKPVWHEIHKIYSEDACAAIVVFRSRAREATGF
jgi:hypothetical protein